MSVGFASARPGGSGGEGTGGRRRTVISSPATLADIGSTEEQDERKILYAILRESTTTNDAGETVFDDDKLLENMKEYGLGISDEVFEEAGVPELKNLGDDEGTLDTLKGLVGKGLDLIDRPSQAILRGFDATFEREGWRSPGLGLANMTYDFGAGLSEAKKGFLGRGQRINAREALDQDPTVGGRLGGAFDTGLVITSDPLTFLSGGGSAALKGAGKTAAKEIAQQTGEEVAENVLRRGVRPSLFAKGSTRAERIGLRPAGRSSGLRQEVIEGLAAQGVKNPRKLLGRAERLDKGGLRLMGMSTPLNRARTQRLTQGLHLSDARYLASADPAAVGKLDAEISAARKELSDLAESKSLGVGTEEALADLNLRYLGAQTKLDDLLAQKEALYSAPKRPDRLVSDTDLLGPKQRTDLQRVGGFNRATRPIRKHFVRNADQNKVVQEGLRQGRDAAESTRYQHLKQTAERLNKTLKGRRLKDMRRLTDEEKTEILNALDVGGSVETALAGDVLSDRSKEVLRALNDIRENDTNALKKFGLTSDELVTETNYIRRQLTDEARQLFDTGSLVKDAPGATTSDLFGGGTFLSRNEALASKPITEINAPGTLRGMGPEYNAMADITEAGGQIYKENPLDAMMTHSAEVAGATARKQYLDDLAKIVDPDTGQALVTNSPTKGYRALEPGTKIIDGQKVPTYYAPHSIAAEVEGAMTVLTDDEVLKKWSKFMDGWMKTWKGYATVPVLFGTGFHARNTAGNLFNNFLAGATNPLAYRRAARLQALDDKVQDAFQSSMRADQTAWEAYETVARSFRGKSTGKLKELGKVTDDDVAMLLEAKRRGIFGTGFFTEDLGKATEFSRRARRNAAPGQGEIGFGGVAKDKARRVKDWAAHENRLVGSGRKIGETIEGNARLGHFINMVDNGLDFGQAAFSVKKHLFDYGHLTPFEQRWMKRIIPFYTFMRNNVPLQMENVVTQPGKYAALSHLQTAGASAIDPQAHTLPGWSMEQGMVPLSEEAKADVNKAIPGNFLDIQEGQPTMIGFDNPAKAAMDAMEPVITTAAFAASPALNNAVGDAMKNHGILPDKDYTSRDVADAWMNLPGGGPTELLVFLVETQTGVDTFTGSEAIKTERSSETWDRLASSLSPLWAKGKSASGKMSDDYKTSELVFKNILGANFSEITPPREEGARRGYLSDLDDAIRRRNRGIDEFLDLDGDGEPDLDETGRKIPNPDRVPDRADLQAAGLLPGGGSGTGPLVSKARGGGYQPRSLFSG